MITASPVPEGSWNATPRETARDRRISRRDLGTLVELLSYPPGYEINADKLALLGSEGRNAMRASLKNLEAAGYVVHIKYQGERGRWLTASFAGNTPAVASALAAAWLEEQEEQTPSSDRGTGFRSSADGASVDRSSADRTSADGALKEERLKNKTDKNTKNQTQDQEPPPPFTAPASATKDASAAQGGGGEDPDVVETQPTNPAAVAVIDALPYTRRPNHKEHAELVLLATDFLAAGYTDAELKTHLGSDLDSARDRISVWRVRLLPDRWPKAGDVASGAIPGQRKPSRPPWCGTCNEYTRMVESRDLDDDDNPLPCPTCRPKPVPAEPRF